MDKPNTLLNSFGYYEIEPKPTAVELREYYQQKYYQDDEGSYAHTYDQEELDFKYDKIKIKSWIIDHIRNGSGGSLLDVGCGEGFVLDYFQGNDWDVKGLDYSKVGCNNHNPHLLDKIVEGDIYDNLRNLAQVDSRFDVIWMDNVLEHVLDPLLLLSNIKRLIGEQGILVVTVPNDFSYLQKDLLRDGKIRNQFWIRSPDHLSYFTADPLERLASEAGWKMKRKIADFPIDWYLANEASNYVEHPERGRAAHRSRMWIRRCMMLNNDISDVAHFYESMANVGMGRNITAFLGVG